MQNQSANIVSRHGVEVQQVVNSAKECVPRFDGLKDISHIRCVQGRHL
jgi:hypothetical protein